MMQAPGELRQKYFDEVYALTILAALNSHLDEEIREVELRARKAIAEKKLTEMEEKDKDEKDGDDNVPVCDDFSTRLGNTSWWVQPVCK